MTANTSDSNSTSNNSTSASTSVNKNPVLVNPPFTWKSVVSEKQVFAQGDLVIKGFSVEDYIVFAMKKLNLHAMMDVILMPDKSPKILTIPSSYAINKASKKITQATQEANQAYQANIDRALDLIKNHPKFQEAFLGKDGSVEAGGVNTLLEEILNKTNNMDYDTGQCGDMLLCVSDPYWIVPNTYKSKMLMYPRYRQNHPSNYTQGTINAGSFAASSSFYSRPQTTIAPTPPSVPNTPSHHYPPPSSTTTIIGGGGPWTGGSSINVGGTMSPFSPNSNGTVTSGGGGVGGSGVLVSSSSYVVYPNNGANWVSNQVSIVAEDFSPNFDINSAPRRGQKLYQKFYDFRRNEIWEIPLEILDEDWIVKYEAEGLHKNWQSYKTIVSNLTKLEEVIADITKEIPSTATTLGQHTIPALTNALGNSLGGILTGGSSAGSSTFGGQITQISSGSFIVNTSPSVSYNKATNTINVDIVLVNNKPAEYIQVDMEIGKEENTENADDDTTSTTK